MAPTIHLTGAGGAALRCDIRPDLGGCIAGFWLGNEAVLRSVAGEQLQDVRSSANFPLLPYSNRMAHCTLSWQGQGYTLRPNFDGGPHSLHGNGWQRAWTVCEQTSTRAVLRLEHTPDADWPFAFECTQTIALEAGSLRLSLAFTNRQAVPAPAGLGWHPYVARRRDARLVFKAATRWDTDADKLPERAVAITGLDAQCDTLALNNCFENWSGVADVHDAVMQTRIASDLPRLLVSTPAGKDFVAIEPVSHVPNAFNRPDALDRGMSVLGPGETLRAWMSIMPRLSA